MNVSKMERFKFVKIIKKSVRSHSEKEAGPLIR